MLRVRERIREGSLQPGEQVKMTLTLENGRVYDGTGEIVSPGVLVSQSTGTLNIRVQFPNPNRDIMPGQFLRVEATLGTAPGILVPQMATSRSSRTGVLTAFVARGGQAVQVTLTDAGSHSNAWIVTDGLNPGDQLIVDGLKNLRAGDKVKADPGNDRRRRRGAADRQCCARVRGDACADPGPRSELRQLTPHGPLLHRAGRSSPMVLAIVTMLAGACSASPAVDLAISGDRADHGPHRRQLCRRQRRCRRKLGDHHHRGRHDRPRRAALHGIELLDRLRHRSP